MVRVADIFRTAVVAGVLLLVFSAGVSADESTALDTTEALLELLEKEPDNIGAMSQDTVPKSVSEIEE